CAVPRTARRRSRRADRRRGARHRSPRRSDGARAHRPGPAGRPDSLTAMLRRRTLPSPGDGTTLAEMIGAVIYVRVSTKEQTENLSLPTQLKACEEYCRRNGYEIRERFHEEGESAKTTDRSQLQALLKY